MMISLLDFVGSQSAVADQESPGKAGSFDKIVEGFISYQSTEFGNDTGGQQAQEDSSQGAIAPAVLSSPVTSGVVIAATSDAVAVPEQELPTVPVDVFLPGTFGMAGILGNIPDERQEEMVEETSSAKSEDDSTAGAEEAVWQSLGKQSNVAAFLRFAEVPTRENQERASQLGNFIDGDQVVFADTLIQDQPVVPSFGGILPSYNSELTGQSVSALPADDVSAKPQLAGNSKPSESNKKPVDIGKIIPADERAVYVEASQVSGDKQVVTDSQAVERDVLMGSINEAEVNNKMKMMETALKSTEMKAELTRSASESEEALSSAKVLDIPKTSEGFTDKVVSRAGQRPMRTNMRPLDLNEFDTETKDVRTVVGEAEVSLEAADSVNVLKNIPPTGSMESDSAVVSKSVINDVNNPEIIKQMPHQDPKAAAQPGLVVKATGASIKYEWMTQEVAEIPKTKTGASNTVGVSATAAVDTAKAGLNTQAAPDNGKNTQSQDKKNGAEQSVQSSLEYKDLAIVDDAAVLLNNGEKDERNAGGPVLSAGGMKIASMSGDKPLSLTSSQPVLSSQSRYVEQVTTLKEFVDRFGRHIAKIVASNESSMTVDLNPPNLGRIQLTCNEDARGLILQLTSSNPEVRSFLVGQENAIKEAVQNSGYKMAGFDVRADGNQSDKRRQAAKSSGEVEEKERKVVQRVSLRTMGSGSSVEAGENKNGNIYLVA